jgi:hypothetical protein
MQSLGVKFFKLPSESIISASLCKQSSMKNWKKKVYDEQKDWFIKQVSKSEREQSSQSTKLIILDNEQMETHHI